MSGADAVREYLQILCPGELVKWKRSSLEVTTCQLRVLHDRSSVNNYSPISILTTMLKIYERIVNPRLINYLEKLSFLADTQYGFLTGRSTDDAIQEFTDFVTRKLYGTFI